MDNRKEGHKIHVFRQGAKETDTQCIGRANKLLEDGYMPNDLQVQYQDGKITISFSTSVVRMSRRTGMRPFND